MTSNQSEHLERIAGHIVQHEEEATIIECLKQLSQTRLFKLEEWRQSSSRLNLLQLAVLYGQKDVAKHLLKYHPKFLQKELYMIQDFGDPNFRGIHAVVESPCEQTGLPSAVEQTQCSAADSIADRLQSNLLLSEPQKVAHNSCTSGKQLGTQICLINHPFHLACLLGDLDSVRLFTEVKQYHGEDCSLKMLTAQYGKELHMLMKSVSLFTIDILQTQEAQGLPLELAVRSGNLNCVRHLLSDVLWQWLSPQYHFLNHGLKGKHMVLHQASCFGWSRVVELLLSAQDKCAVNCRDRHGQTPLHLALWNGDTETIRLLLENGADTKMCTSSGSDCLQILFRSKLQPFKYEANCELLLQAGMDVCARHDKDDHGKGTSPLYVLIDEFIYAHRQSLMMWQKNVAGILSHYVQSAPGQDKPPHNVSSYLEYLLRCMRLLLKVGADPNIPDCAEGGRNALEVILTSNGRSHLVANHPTMLFSAVSLLFEFGATTKQEDDYPYLFHFLSHHIPSIPDVSLQTQFIQLFCRNGISADAICQCLLSHCKRLQAEDSTVVKWQPACVFLLANMMQVKAMTTLQHVLQYLKFADNHEENRGMLLSPLYGDPVRSMRHMCKVAVLKQLGYRHCSVDSLSLPNVVKSYLKDDYF